jgi:modification methylase
MNEIDAYKNKFLHGDALETMRALPSESINLCITSPPYNIWEYNGMHNKKMRSQRWKSSKLLEQAYENFDDYMVPDEYIEYQRNCISEMLRLLKPTGAIFYNHKYRIRGGLLDDRSNITQGFPVRQIIIWARNGTYFSHETFFMQSYEVIFLICKPYFRLAKDARGRTDVWRFNYAANNSHPAPFPIDMIKYAISSTTAQLVLDPFMGSGTTAVAAYALGRDFIGIEQSEKYIVMAQKRLLQEKQKIPNILKREHHKALI